MIDQDDNSSIVEYEDYPLIDFVVSVSDEWRFPYLENCCLSIINQEYPKDKISITVVHTTLDGRDNSVDRYSEFCRSIGSRLIFLHQSDPMYNKSKSQNAGGRSGRGEFVSFVDCDIVLYPRVIKTAVPILSIGSAAVISMKRTNLYPHDDNFVKMRTSVFDDIEWSRMCRDNSGFRRDANGCIVVPRSAFEAVRGYDERLYGWGVEDTDFAIRIGRFLQSRGNSVEHLCDHGSLLSLHQSHPSRRADEIDGTKRNRTIYKKPQSPSHDKQPWGMVPILPTGIGKAEIDQLKKGEVR